MASVYLVILYDNCGDAYNDIAYADKEKAIEYAYQQIKNDENLLNWYDDDTRTVGYELWVKNMLREDGYIDEIGGIEKIEVKD